MQHGMCPRQILVAHRSVASVHLGKLCWGNEVFKPQRWPVSEMTMQRGETPWKGAQRTLSHETLVTEI